MTDIQSIAKVIKKIQNDCITIDTMEADRKKQQADEVVKMSEKTNEAIKVMKAKYKAFKDEHFGKLREQIYDMLEGLREDYSAEVSKLVGSANPQGLTSNKKGKKGERTPMQSIRPVVGMIGNVQRGTQAEMEARFAACMVRVNALIDEMNHADFDALVPPVKIMVEPKKKETFFTGTSENDPNKEEWNADSQQRKAINDPKPLSETVKKLVQASADALAYLDAIEEEYDAAFRIDGYIEYVEKSAKAWLAEFEGKGIARVGKKLEELFLDEKSGAIQKDFFIELEEEGKRYDVDVKTGTNEFLDKITIGDVDIPVESTAAHLEYMGTSPVLKKYVSGGSLKAPMILDLKTCGNILLSVDDETYSEKTVKFVNQIIIQFLLSFPANRINFCLIDIDNKMGFSQFKILTKINNGILGSGIIRDDRQLENTIKDMEQSMYKVDDDILSYNNVENIYEYNEKYEANPQNVTLFVLVNSPSGMRDDLAKRVLKFVENGNRAGIFSLIVNNTSVPLTPYFKKEEHQRYMEGLRKACVCIDKKGPMFVVNNGGLLGLFQPKNNISVSSLGEIVEMLQAGAESNRQKVVPLTQLFDAADQAASSAKKIADPAEVLDIPIGVRGGEIQSLLLKTTGDGSAHAVLIGGTGSGKSNLLHTIIMNVCYKYSPEDVNLYLVDFKGGVEFKYYEANKVRDKQLPHIKLTGLTSDLEDGVAILRNLQKELRRREDEFRSCRVEDIVQYRALGKKMARLFVIIDEIQELFERDEALGEKAIGIMREIFKKGRAFGINILWASQNVPRVHGLKDKILSQIGNRISLRLNEPEDAAEIKIDPKVVKNLNRPEKGLGVINDIRYGNESVEFRVAYAETSENRRKYSDMILTKWKKVSDAMEDKSLFIVGDDDEATPMDGGSAYTVVPKAEDVVSKSFDSYDIYLGQDYITGQPAALPISLCENKANMVFTGFDVEILRDMMGYSLLSLVMNHKTNADCVSTGAKIYCASGEMITPKNSRDLFNIVRQDFADVVENVSSPDKLRDCIKNAYLLYKERNAKAETSEYAEVMPPHFIVIHSLQRYADLFETNPELRLTEAAPAEEEKTTSGLMAANDITSLFKKSPSVTSTAGKRENASVILFNDAFKTLLSRAGKFGIHVIISLDNPVGIAALKNELIETTYKILTKGLGANVVGQFLGDYSRSASNLTNPKVALVTTPEESIKVRVYRYEDAQDSAWYHTLCKNYKALEGGAK